MLAELGMQIGGSLDVIKAPPWLAARKARPVATVRARARSSLRAEEAVHRHNSSFFNSGVRHEQLQGFVLLLEPFFLQLCKCSFDKD